MRKRLLSILLLCALLAGSASAAQLPAEDAASPDVLSAGERITGAGIDVSQYQGVIDWDTTAQYIDFAIIRCGRGSDLTAQDDTKWAVNTAACERLGIPYGVYLYSLAQTDEEARSEAAHALRLLDGQAPAAAGVPRPGGQRHPRQLHEGRGPAPRDHLLRDAAGRGLFCRRVRQPLLVDDHTG